MDKTAPSGEASRVQKMSDCGAIFCGAMLRLQFKQNFPKK